MDWQLGQHVKGTWQHRSVALDGGNQAAIQCLDSHAASWPLCQQPAFDRPLDAGSSHPGGTEADELKQTETKRIVPPMHEAECQRTNVIPEAVPERVSRDGARHGHRVFDRHAPVRPSQRHYLGEMAQLEFSAEETIKCSPERAFDYFADHRHVAAVVEGINEWKPIGPKSKGKGARFEVEMVALGLPLKSVLRIERWRRPHEISWVSESGMIKQQGGFTFTKVKEGTHVVLRISYTPPAAMLRAAVASPLRGLASRQVA